MIYLRSTLYQILFLPWTLILCVGYLPLLVAAPRLIVQHAARFWLEGALWMQKYVLGLSFEVVGAEHLPKGGAILAAKHQSAWETMVFHRLVGDPAFVLKRELLRLPLIGWYMRRTEQIPIDRASRGTALKQMLDKGKRAVAQGRSLVIFPEGTRQPTGHAGRLNSGLFWGRNAFLRYPGKITLQILPPIPPGLDREAFMSRLQHDIETATRALERRPGG